MERRQTGLRLLGQEPGKAEPGNTTASSGRPDLGAFSGVELPKALPAFEELMAVIVSCSQ